jgi:hypothetical protein
MKSTLTLLVLLFGLIATTVAHAADQAAPTALTPELAAAVAKAAKSGDMQALADLVVNNPGYSVLIAQAAATANPAKVGIIAATVAKNDKANAAAIAVAAATAPGVPASKAGEIAGSVYYVVKGSMIERSETTAAAIAIASAVAKAVPQELGAIVSQVSAHGVGTGEESANQFYNAIAAATNTTAHDVRSAVRNYHVNSSSTYIDTLTQTIDDAINAATGNLVNPVEPGLHVSPAF